MKVRTKPVIKEAVQVTDSTFDAPHPNPEHIPGVIYDPRRRCVFVHTLEGTMRAGIAAGLADVAAGRLRPLSEVEAKLGAEPCKDCAEMKEIAGVKCARHLAEDVSKWGAEPENQENRQETIEAEICRLKSESTILTAMVEDRDRWVATLGKANESLRSENARLEKELAGLRESREELGQVLQAIIDQINPCERMRGTPNYTCRWCYAFASDPKQVHHSASCAYNTAHAALAKLEGK